MKARYKKKGSLDKAIKAYFEVCLNNKRVPSKVGLALFLGIDKAWLSRHNDKEKYPEHCNAIKRAYGSIEESWLQLLATGKPVGAIFYLKNAFKEDYRDRQEYEHSTPEPMKVNVTIHNANNRPASDKSIPGDVPSTE